MQSRLQRGLTISGAASFVAGLGALLAASLISSNALTSGLVSYGGSSGDTGSLSSLDPSAIPSLDPGTLNGTLGAFSGPSNTTLAFTTVLGATGVALLALAVVLVAGLIASMIVGDVVGRRHAPTVDATEPLAASGQPGPGADPAS